MKQVTIYTDGACSGNPGPGGWGAILQYGQMQKELSGGEPQTTNNRMELTGVITALEALKEPCVVELYSDSKYVIDGLQKGWAGLEGQGLDQIGQEAGPEPGSMGPPADAVRLSHGASPLGQGPRGEQVQQPLRRACRGGEQKI